MKVSFLNFLIYLFHFFIGKTDKEVKEIDPDSLPLAPCLAALSELRRAKFYQVKAAPIEGMNMIMTVLRDVRQRVHTWEPLTSWVCYFFLITFIEVVFIDFDSVCEKCFGIFWISFVSW